MAKRGNPYHDKSGKFASGPSGGGPSRTQRFKNALKVAGGVVVGGVAAAAAVALKNHIMMQHEVDKLHRPYTNKHLAKIDRKFISQTDEKYKSLSSMMASRQQQRKAAKDEVKLERFFKRHVSNRSY